VLLEGVCLGVWVARVGDGEGGGFPSIDPVPDETYLLVAID